MAFTSAITERPKSVGHMRVSMGTYTNSDSGTGGNVNTGLRKCHHIQLQPSGSAVIASAPSVNETLPCTGTAVTIVNTADECGFWIAWGY